MDDINVREEQGLQFIDAACKNQPAKLNALWEKGADVNAVNIVGETALMLAARNGHLDIVRRLCELQADVNALTNVKWTALMEAALAGQAAVADYLLEKGAAVNQQTAVGATTLIFAAANGYTHIVKSLLAAGAEKEVVIRSGDYKGMTAMQFAVRNDFREIIQLLS